MYQTQSHCLHSLLDSNSLTTDTHSLGSDSVTPATLSPTPVRLCDSACSTTLVTTLGHILSSSQTFSSSETRPANHRSRHCTLCTLCTILLLYTRYLLYTLYTLLTTISRHIIIVHPHLFDLALKAVAELSNIDVFNQRQSEAAIAFKSLVSRHHLETSFPVSSQLAG